MSDCCLSVIAKEQNGPALPPGPSGPVAGTYVGFADATYVPRIFSGHELSLGLTRLLDDYFRVFGDPLDRNILAIFKGVCPFTKGYLDKLKKRSPELARLLFGILGGEEGILPQYCQRSGGCTTRESNRSVRSCCQALGLP